MTGHKPAEEKIRAAYVALCETKPYYKIKVSEVVAKAGINRTTFYKHYIGMPDLILAMYRYYSKLILAETKECPVRTPAELEAYVELVWARLMARRAEILAILHQPGVLRMMFMYGRALQKKLIRLAKRAEITDPAVYRNISYVPYIFAVRLFLAIKGDDILDPSLQRQQQLFDFTQSIQENLSRYMAAELGGSGDFHYDLFGAYIKLTTTTDDEDITVTKLLDAAGISRTQFYLYYKNIDDFREKFYYTCFELAIEIMLYVCRKDAPLDEPEVEAIRSTIFDAYNRKAVTRLIASGKIIEYGAYIVAHLYLRYLDQIERDYGKLTDEEKNALVYYIGVMSTVSLKYYLRQIDYATYRAEIRAGKETMRRVLIEKKNRIDT